MSTDKRMIIINIPTAWVPGRDSFVRLHLKPDERYQFEPLLPYAEIAASVIVWHAQRREGFEPLSYRDLHKLKSPQIGILNPSGELYTATRLMMGIRVLIDLGLAENDKNNERIVIKEDLLDAINICEVVTFSTPCA